jgi:hypothetical protein
VGHASIQGSWEQWNRKPAQAQNIGLHMSTFLQTAGKCGEMDHSAFAEITCKSSDFCKNFCEPLLPNSLQYLRFCLYQTSLSRFSVPLLPNTLYTRAGDETVTISSSGVQSYSA